MKKRHLTTVSIIGLKNTEDNDRVLAKSVALNSDMDVINVT